MAAGPRDTITPFIFSDPAGKRWPRLRLALLIAAVVIFIATVLFVQTLFVAPQLQVPFSLRQLKGQLKSLQKKNPAGQTTPTDKPLWEKFATGAACDEETRRTTTAARASAKEICRTTKCASAFYTNGDPYSYASLEQHAAQLLTSVRNGWRSWMVSGNLQIDADNRLPKLTASKGLALMPLLTNLVGDTWQPEAVENLAHGPAERQDQFVQKVLNILRERESGRRSGRLGTGRSGLQKRHHGIAG